MAMEAIVYIALLALVAAAIRVTGREARERPQYTYAGRVKVFLSFRSSRSSRQSTAGGGGIDALAVTAAFKAGEGLLRFGRTAVKWRRARARGVLRTIHRGSRANLAAHGAASKQATRRLQAEMERSAMPLAPEAHQQAARWQFWRSADLRTPAMRHWDGIGRPARRAAQRKCGCEACETRERDLRDGLRA